MNAIRILEIDIMYKIAKELRNEKEKIKMP